MNRGAFILFEGLDRCGKSTQTRRLVQALNDQGIKASLSVFPDRTTMIGQMINQYLQSKVNMADEAIHLFFSLNRWEALDSIKSRLESGETVVVDRYAYSGVAFSAAKGLDVDWCASSDKGLPKPDALIYLDISVDEAAKRGAYGEEKYETRELQEKVKKVFDTLKDSSWKVLDATKSADDLHLETVEIALETIARVKTLPIGKLWE